MSTVLIYVTASSVEEAQAIGRALVSERLVACVNLLPGMTSMYWWNGGVQEDQEVSMILKTQADLVDRVTERVKELHSYDCPCAVALSVAGGNPAFLEWIVSETIQPAEN